MLQELVASRLLAVTQGPLVVCTALQATAPGRPGELEQFWTAAQHPRDPKLVLVANGAAVQLWDVQV